MTYLQENLLNICAWSFLISIPSFIIIACFAHFVERNSDTVYVWRWDPYACGLGSKRPKLFKRLLNPLRLNYLNLHILLDIDSRIVEFLLIWGEVKGAEARDKAKAVLTWISDLITIIAASLVVAPIGNLSGMTLASGSLILFAKLILARIDVVAK